MDHATPRTQPIRRYVDFLARRESTAAFALVAHKSMIDSPPSWRWNTTVCPLELGDECTLNRRVPSIHVLLETSTGAAFRCVGKVVVRKV
jgi:hypothetical protein